MSRTVKYLVGALALIFMVAGFSFAEDRMTLDEVFNELFGPIKEAVEEVKEAEEKEEAPKPFCPEYKWTMPIDDCKACHVLPSFELKKQKPYDEWETATPFGLDIYLEDGLPVMYYTLKGTVEGATAERFFEIIKFGKFYDIKKLVLEVHSPGGSLFGASRIVGLLDDYKRFGGTVETHLHGFGASAAFYIFMEGDTRYISRNGMLMWHELYTFKFFDVTAPSDSEQESKVLRYIQDTVNTWLSERCDLTKEELDSMVANHKELWANGTDAVKYGFAQGFLEDK